MIDYVVTRLVVGGLDTNCYILKHRASRAAAVSPVSPVSGSAPSARRISSVLSLW